MSKEQAAAFFRQDITEQPAVLHNLLDAYSTTRRGEVGAVARQLNTGQPVILLGMGTSHYLCISAAYSFISQGVPAEAPEAGEWIYYLAEQNKTSPVVAVSCSGESIEIVHIKKPDVAIVNAVDSTVGRAAKTTLPMLVGEIHTSTTKGVTNPLALLQLIAHQTAGTFQQQFDALRRTADAMATMVKNDIGAELYDWFGQPDFTDVLGRGPAYGMARVGGMLLREMVRVRNDAMPGASFRHGAVLEMGPGHKMISLASGKTAELGHAVARDAAKAGSQVILITDQPGQHSGKNLKVVTVPDLGEECFQYLALQVMEQYIAAGTDRHGTEYSFFVTTKE